MVHFESYRTWGLVDWLWKWWIPSSCCILRQTEKKILSCLKSSYKGFYVDIGPVVGNCDKIWTIGLNTASDKIPLVLFHGLGSGVALWCLNLDSFAARRPVYAIDLLGKLTKLTNERLTDSAGFGRSSRPIFSSDGLKAEEQLVASLEEWRKEMCIEKMIILGHNMGGFLAMAYALKYPERVVHIIAADLWGFAERPNSGSKNETLLNKLMTYVSVPLNPLFALRAAGPFGDWLIKKAKPDFVKRFAPLLDNDPSVISQYIFQCNAQPPTGEAAFKSMTYEAGWAKNPLINRMNNLDRRIPITLLNGSRSWIDYTAGDIIREKRGASSYVNVQVISGAGNHLYADKSDIFNRYVTEACDHSD